MTWDDNLNLTLHAEDGSERLVITADERLRLFNDALATYDSYRPIVIHSDDGINWSRQWWSDLSGLNEGSQQHIVSLGDRVIISAVQLPGTVDNPDDTSAPLPSRIVIVGTPKP